MITWAAQSAAPKEMLSVFRLIDNFSSWVFEGPMCKLHPGHRVREVNDDGLPEGCPQCRDSVDDNATADATDAPSDAMAPSRGRSVDGKRE